MWIEKTTKDLLNRDPSQYCHDVSQSPLISLTSIHLGVFPCYLKSVLPKHVTECVTIRCCTNYNIWGQLCFKKDKLNILQNILKSYLARNQERNVTKALISISTNGVEEMVEKELVKFGDEATLRYGRTGTDCKELHENFTALKCWMINCKVEECKILHTRQDRSEPIAIYYCLGIRFWGYTR